MHRLRGCSNVELYTQQHIHPLIPTSSKGMRERNNRRRDFDIQNHSG